MPRSKRRYKVKDVDMLIAASTILETAIKNKTFLQSKRSKWADPFFYSTKARVDEATRTFLGLDSAKELRQATQAVYAIQRQAIAVLSELKVQISADFNKDKLRRDEILNQLGFASFYSKSRKYEQEALISLLYQFNANLTEGLRAEIADKGTELATLDAILGFADILKTANVGQEVLKGQRKSMTAHMTEELNGIYNEMIGICVVASRLYKDNPGMKQRFSFKKVLQALNAKPKSAAETDQKAA